MLADALAACGVNSAFDPYLPTLDPGLDSSLSHIRQLMAAADCDGTGTSYNKSFGGWIKQRGEEGCNRQPGSSLAAKIDVQPLQGDDVLNVSYQGALTCDDLNGFSDKLYRDIQYAALQSCVASRLRFALPGAASADSLLLSGAEQRAILNAIREHAGLALQQYARLGQIVAFATPDGQTCLGKANPGTRVLNLMAWRDQGQTQPQLARMAEDIASVLQLEVQATEDLLELTHRSASARSSTGDPVAALPDQYWGPGSWRQRALAVAYGGDPLSPGATGAWHQTVPTAMTWPSLEQLPYVRTPLPDPRAMTLKQLARECDVMDLDLAPSSNTCATVDRASSADMLYRRVEACLRTQDCAKPPIAGETGCSTVTASQVNLGAGYESFTLWKRHRVQPQHAAELVGSFAESVEPVCYPYLPSLAQRASGVYNVDGEIRADYDASRGVNVLHLPKSSRLVPRDVLQHAPLFTEMASPGLPATFFPMAAAQSQGFPDTPESAPSTYEGRRLAGSVSTLASLRDAIVSAFVDGNHPAVETYFAHAPGMLAMVAGAIGDRHVAIRPELTEVDTGGGPTELVQSTLNGAPLWLIDVVVPSTDPTWESEGVTYTLFAKQGDPWAASLAQASPGSKAFGKTLFDVLDGSIQNLSVEKKASSEIQMKRIRFRIALQPQFSDSGLPWTFIVKKQPPYKAASYELAASNVSLGRYSAPQHFLADGGSFGKKLSAMLAKDVLDPSRPAVDAFGLSLQISPPVNPAVLEKTGPSAATYYLEKAKSATDEATAAVSIAFEGLIQQEADEATQTAATLKAKGVIEEQKKAMCGAANPNCSIDTVTIKLATLTDPEDAAGDELPVDTIWKRRPPCLADWTPEGPSAMNQLHCALLDVLLKAKLPGGMPFAKPVYDHLKDPAPPAFSEFAGGTMQSAMLKQWNEYQQLREAGQALIDATIASDARIHAADVALAGATEIQKTLCDIRTVDKALHSFEYDTPGLSEVTGSDAFQSTASSVPVVGGLLGGGSRTEEHKRQCQQATVGMDNAKANDAVAAWEALSGVQAQAGHFLQTVVSLRQSVNDLEATKLTAKLAQDRANLDAELTAYSLKTQFGVYRRYHDYDMWRAKTLLESARRQAVVARRAIESQLLVDMSAMNADEPFVAKPSSWADEIYEYDLDMPSAVGIAKGEKQDGAIYPNKLKDYIGNLEKLVQGFALARPWATAQLDGDVVQIPGPTTKRKGSQVQLDASAFAWSFLCDGVWKQAATVANVAKVCAVAGKPGLKPTRARVSFSLDPWGRLNQSLATEPYTDRVNARFGKIAVNLVGTGILDCAKASDPAGCYSQSFVRYDLTHGGPAWTKSYDGQWHELRIPLGRVEAGKALAAEEWLDPVSNGWGKPFVEAVARAELSERPTDGNYAIELVLGPEVRVEHIERVQLLVQTSYWVKQK